MNRMYRLTTGINVPVLQQSNSEYEQSVAALQKDIRVKQLHGVYNKADKDVGQDIFDLADLFNKHGSDKATKHNYFLLYGGLLDRTKPFNLLEIGIGTNDPSLPSSMGKYGKPGASLRAFKDWAPNAQIYGADVDKGCLFTEERIDTFFVDQTKPGTFKDIKILNHNLKYTREEFVKTLPQCDLIIDDGLHRPHANFNTLKFAMPLLKPGGTFVVEDILPQYVPLWNIAIQVFREYHMELLQTKSELVCVVTNRDK